jgi:hypothetical protein
MKALGTFLLTLAVAVSGCSKPEPKGVPGDQARALLVNRNWLSKMPENRRDQFFVYRFIPEFNNSGVYQDRVLYYGLFELFAFEHTGEEIRFNLLHKNEKRQVHYRIEELSPGEAPPPFDLRLTFDRSPRGPATFYGWKAEGHDQDHKLTDKDLDQDLSSLLNQLKE